MLTQRKMFSRSLAISAARVVLTERHEPQPGRREKSPRGRWGIDAANDLGDLRQAELFVAGMKRPLDFFLAFSPEREVFPATNSSAWRRSQGRCGINPPSGRARFSLRPGCGSCRSRQHHPRREMAKLLENIFRCVNIALVNELKLLCLRMGVDVWESSTRLHQAFRLHAVLSGPGLGGHCIPVDPFYLSWKAREYDFSTRFIELAGEINTSMPYHVVDSVTEALNLHKKSLSGSKILVLGVAYKKDVDDLRESPR